MGKWRSTFAVPTPPAAVPIFTPETSPIFLGPNGQETPLALAANDALRESVRKWYRNAFGETIGISAQGSYSELVATAPSHDLDVRVAHSGRGLSHVLPVVVMALTASEAGPGVDVIEHPEAELHPAAHAHVAELLLANLAGPQRPLVIETHSEMLLLRARRWVAEGRLPADDVVVYWVHTEPGLGSAIRRIRIKENGELDSWPDGVFVEDYEEILAIRRAPALGCELVRIKIDPRVANDPAAHRWLDRILNKIEDGWHVWDTTDIPSPDEIESTSWVCDPGRQGASVREMLVASTSRDAWTFTPHGRSVRITARPLACDELTPEHASRLTEEPLCILVENRFSDGSF